MARPRSISGPKKVERTWQRDHVVDLQPLHPSSKGARVKFSSGKTSVIDGPFAETKELVAGFWLWKCKSLEEAVEWLKRAPFEDTEAEIRQVFEAEDFGAEFTPELREQEGRIREQIAAQ